MHKRYLETLSQWKHTQRNELHRIEIIRNPFLNLMKEVTQVLFTITDTFSHEAGDGAVKDAARDARVVGHWIFLHLLERRELHDSVDDLLRERQVQVLHDSHYFSTGILVEERAEQHQQIQSSADSVSSSVFDFTISRESRPNLFHVLIEQVEDVPSLLLLPVAFHMVVPGAP